MHACLLLFPENMERCSSTKVTNVAAVMKAHIHKRTFFFQVNIASILLNKYFYHLFSATLIFPFSFMSTFYDDGTHTLVRIHAMRAKRANALKICTASILSSHSIFTDRFAMFCVFASYLFTIYIVLRDFYENLAAKMSGVWEQVHQIK